MLFDLYDQADFSPVGAVSAESVEDAEALGERVLGAPVFAIPAVTHDSNDGPWPVRGLKPLGVMATSGAS